MAWAAGLALHPQLMAAGLGESGQRAFLLPTSGGMHRHHPASSPFHRRGS